MNDLPLRPNVCLLIYNLERKLFLGERDGNPGVWQLPQGGVEPIGSIEENVLREASEEMGAPIDKFRIIQKLKATHQYDFVNPPAYAIGRWRGQSQTFWLVEFIGENSEINLSKYHPEFMSYRWCSSEQVRSLAEPRRLTGYLPALLEFDHYFLG